jgi:hypothetical protein
MRGRRPVGLGERRDLGRDVVDLASSAPRARAVHARDRTDLGDVTPVDLLERVADLADGRHGPGRVDGERQQVALARSPRSVSASSAASTGVGVALGPQALELRDLLCPHRALSTLRTSMSSLCRGGTC